MHKNLDRFWLFIKSYQKKIRIRHTEKFVIHNRQSAIGPYRIITVRTANTRIPVHAVFYIFLYTVPFGRAYIKCFSTINLSDVDFSELPNRWHK